MRFLAVSLVLMVAPALAAGPRGVPNFHQVNANIYRGGQPTPEGLGNLARLGIRTVVDLRGGNEHVETERAAVLAASMQYVHVPLPGMSAPRDEDIRKILAVLDDAARWPVFVHCRRGKDRAGLVIACYRIAHDRWQNQQALKEARQLGMSRVERSMMRYVLEFEPDRPNIRPVVRQYSVGP